MTTTRPVDAAAIDQPRNHSDRTPRFARGRRTAAAVIVAALLLLLAGFALWQTILIESGRRPYPLDAAVVSARLNQTPWSDGVVLAVGSALVVLGLWLVLLAVLPSRRRLIGLREDHPDVATGIRPTDLRRALGAAAERVDGISAARCSLARGIATVTVTSPLGNPAGLVEKVTAELTEQLAHLDPRDPLTPRVALVQGGRR